MDWFTDLLVVICLVLVVLPPKYDPAIRWKLWLQERDYDPDAAPVHQISEAQRVRMAKMMERDVD